MRTSIRRGRIVTIQSLPIVATSYPGRQTLEFSGDGIADNDAVGRIVFDDARLQRRVTYEIIIPGYGSLCRDLRGL